MTYTLPTGVISEARDHNSMLLDLINWMSVQDGLYDTMNALATQNGDGGWSEGNYIQHRDANDGDYACAIFDIMNDLAGFLPEGHMWGFSDGKIGIFECRIKIVTDEHPYDDKTIDSFKMIAAIMEQIAPLAESMARLSGAAIIRLGSRASESDRYFLESSREIGDLMTKDGRSIDFVYRRLIGEIAHRENRNNRKG